MITYENVVFDRIIESLNTLLADEFSIPVRYDEHKGNQSFLITPGEDELIEQTVGMQVRSYNINISYAPGAQLENFLILNYVELCPGGVTGKNYNIKLRRVMPRGHNSKKLRH